ncbi:MAG: glyoxylase family protein, partial [Mycobacterium sp.]|nr:glyoxylase family protein [Mycobacterium sp.]
SNSGSMTGMVIATCTIAILACGPFYARTRRRGSISGMVITANSIAHVRLTVSDIERSRQFYESVFGWPVLIEIPDKKSASVS